MAALILLAACGRASGRPEALTLARVTPREPGVAMKLSSPALDANGAIGARYSAYGQGVSPPLRWTAVQGAGSYAIVVEDPDASATPFVHWMIWNIPAATNALPEGLPKDAQLSTPSGAVQGRGDIGSVGYFGPRPPAGTGIHHYHVQIFALDGPLTLRPDAKLDTLVGAMQGHVIADGELVGTYAAPSQ
jgi:Raf kinase inhibitor-like YbhB/YbcL family protein